MTRQELITEISELTTLIKHSKNVDSLKTYVKERIEKILNEYNDKQKVLEEKEKRTPEQERLLLSIQNFTKHLLKYKKTH